MTHFVTYCYVLMYWELEKIKINLHMFYWSLIRRRLRHTGNTASGQEMSFDTGEYKGNICHGIYFRDSYFLFPRCNFCPFRHFKVPLWFTSSIKNELDKDSNFVFNFVTKFFCGSVIKFSYNLQQLQIYGFQTGQFEYLIRSDIPWQIFKLEQLTVRKMYGRWRRETGILCWTAIIIPLS